VTSKVKSPWRRWYDARAFNFCLQYDQCFLPSLGVTCKKLWVEKHYGIFFKMGFSFAPYRNYISESKNFKGVLQNFGCISVPYPNWISREQILFSGGMISLGFLEFHMALKDFNNWLARYGNRPGSRSVSPKPCGCTGKNNSAGRPVAVIPAYASGTPELPVLMSDILHFLYFLASSCTFFYKSTGLQSQRPC